MTSSTWHRQTLSLDQQLALKPRPATSVGTSTESSAWKRSNGSSTPPTTISPVAPRSPGSYRCWPSGSPANDSAPWSGGSEPASTINPAAIEANAERGTDISGEYPKPWTDEVVRAADVVITMGCGDACPVFPGRRYEEWVLDDPAGLALEDIRPIRDDIERRVRALLTEITEPEHPRTQEPQ
jgi:protein-tyrosine-phosphatase